VASNVNILCELKALNDKFDSFAQSQAQTNDLIQNLIDCLCGPCDGESTLDSECLGYSHPLASGYDNWRDADDLEDLAGEFGTTSDGTIYLRIIEHDCDGTALSTVGQVFGPYTPGPGVVDQAIADLYSATSNTCISVNNTGNPGGYGANSLNILTDSTVTEATLVVQEGAGDGAGGVNWFTSAQGWTKRGSDVGDFISSSGNAATSDYASADQATIEGKLSWYGCET